MKGLIDTNIILDVLLDRKPFSLDGLKLFERIETGQLQGVIAATTVTNIFYILRKMLGRDAAIAAIKRLLISFELCAVNRSVVEWAIQKDLKDFEDGVQVACAAIAQLDAIVTRDRSDFVNLEIPVLTVADLLNQQFSKASISDTE